MSKFIFQTPPHQQVNRFWRIEEGDALETLRGWGDSSVRCWVTSPPYHKKFDYGCPGQCGLEDSVAQYVSYQQLVAEEMLRCSTDDANLFLVIADTFQGSGGTGGDFKRGTSYGPHAIGIELSPRFAEAARVRIEKRGH